MRSARGGWVENNALIPDAMPWPKNMWLASGAFGCSICEPVSKPPIFFNAPAMPSGLRVNCTADASARNSRCRLTEALMRLPKKVPRKPMIISPNPGGEQRGSAVIAPPAAGEIARPNVAGCNR